ncbi:MAG: DUF1292 domain-containing protein [Bacilli bacterium]|nr:DUF1292 domain-containing protein [Bacilli bacterium]
MDKKFKITDEQNIEREANLITIFENEGKEYAVYSIDRDVETVNIFVSRIEKDTNGVDTLKDITDPAEKLKIDNIVKEMIKLPL